MNYISRFCVTVARIILLLVAGTSVLDARIGPSWSYQEMFDKADLVVIAEVMSTARTKEERLLDDIKPTITVQGLITGFKSLVILKGSPGLATFQLHHYGFHSEDERLHGNGPNLIYLTGEHQTFLMFLIKEKTADRYLPVTDQTDPASFSVLELKGGGY